MRVLLSGMKTGARPVAATLLLVGLVGLSLSVDVPRAAAANVGDQIAALAAS